MRLEQKQRLGPDNTYGNWTRKGGEKAWLPTSGRHSWGGGGGTRRKLSKRASARFNVRIKGGGVKSILQDSITRLLDF